MVLVMLLKQKQSSTWAYVTKKDKKAVTEKEEKLVDDLSVNFIGPKRANV